MQIMDKALELAEIADCLVIEIPIREWVDNEPKNVMTDIATMLRQQQAEIEELKTIRGNSVLVPSDKLQAMQAEIKALKLILQKQY